MDRIEFLNQRIAALKQSIHSNQKMIGLWEVAQDVDAKSMKSDIAEMERRIRIDQELLAERESELDG